MISVIQCSNSARTSENRSPIRILSQPPARLPANCKIPPSGGHRQPEQKVRSSNETAHRYFAFQVMFCILYEKWIRALKRESI